MRILVAFHFTLLVLIILSCNSDKGHSKSSASPNTQLVQTEIFMGLQLGMEEEAYHSKIEELKKQGKLSNSKAIPIYNFPNIINDGIQTSAALFPCFKNGKLSYLKLLLGVLDEKKHLISMAKTQGVFDIITLYKSKYGQETTYNIPEVMVVKMFTLSPNDNIYISFGGLEDIPAEDFISCTIIYSSEKLALNENLLSAKCTENNDI